MSRKSKFSVEEKIRLIHDIENRSEPLESICSRLGIHSSTYYEWKRIIKTKGHHGLVCSTSNQVYTDELKSLAVQDYLNGDCSQKEVCQKHGIKSNAQLRDWIKKYNGHETNKPHKVGERVMTKGRTTTLIERIEIAGYCIANKNANARLEAENLILKKLEMLERGMI